MKQLITLLLISLMVLSACEPLQTPPDTIETDIQVFNPTGTSTPEPLPADTSHPPTETVLPRPTSTLLPTNPPVPTPESEIVPGELVEIPEGAFMMGCDVENNGDLGCRAADLPFHEVTLPA